MPKYAQIPNRSHSACLASPNCSFLPSEGHGHCRCVAMKQLITSTVHVEHHAASILERLTLEGSCPGAAGLHYPIFVTIAETLNMGVSIKWRYPKIDGLYWKIPLKWMIWDYTYFRKPPYGFQSSPRLQRRVLHFRWMSGDELSLKWAKS